MTLKRPPAHKCALLAAALLALGLLAACAAPEEIPMPAADLQIENARDAQITAQQAGRALLLDIASESGIGGADLRLGDAVDVRDIILRLRLRGLEQLTFGAPDGTLVTLSVPSGAAANAELGAEPGAELPVLQTLRVPGAAAATPIARGHPWWMETGIVSDDPALPALPANIRIPLQGAHFEVTVPAAFLRSDARSFSLVWVDFFR